MKRRVGKTIDAANAADLKATEALDEFRDTPLFQGWALVAKLGDQPELRLISAGFIAAGLASRNGRLAAAGMRMLVAHELATLAKDFIKTRIDRTRPRSAGSVREAKARRGGRTGKEHTSFPSGHSAGSVAVAQAFAREFPEHRLPALTAAAAVALGQIPKTAHYPSDVAAGAILGTAAEALVSFIWPASAETRAAPKMR